LDKFVNGSRVFYEAADEDLLNQVREAVNNVVKDIKPETIGKKVVDNVENHSTDTKRGELN